MMTPDELLPIRDSVGKFAFTRLPDEMKRAIEFAVQKCFSATIANTPNQNAMEDMKIRQSLMEKRRNALALEVLISPQLVTDLLREFRFHDTENKSQARERKEMKDSFNGPNG